MGLTSDVPGPAKWPAATVIAAMLLALALWTVWMYRHRERAARDFLNLPSNIIEESDTTDARAAWLI